MNFWNRIVLGAKFLFVGWESALDYWLKFFNDYLNNPEIVGKIDKVYKTTDWALCWLIKLRKYVPNEWLNEFDAIVGVLTEILSVVEDHQLTAAELKGLAEEFSKAKDKWNED